MILKIASGDYMGKIAADGNVKLYIKGKVQETGQSFGKQDVVELRKPKLTVTVWDWSFKLDSGPVLYLLDRLSNKGLEPMTVLLTAFPFEMNNNWWKLFTNVSEVKQIGMLF